MASYMTCLFQLNTHCWECNNTIRAALCRVYGVSSVTVDSMSDTVKVVGKVDPHRLLTLMLPYDTHVRLLWAKPTSYADDYYHCHTRQPLVPIVPHAGGCYQQHSRCTHDYHHSGCNIM
uniref:HMA domain-containing protein n=1 Tax=Kalanchoe fedtschenkoi TaxID=63787 RepID=A0A7N0TXV9_KALFE